MFIGAAKFKQNEVPPVLRFDPGRGLWKPTPHHLHGDREKGVLNVGALLQGHQWAAAPVGRARVKKQGNSQGPKNTLQQLTGNGWGRGQVQGQTRLLVALLLRASVLN